MKWITNHQTSTEINRKRPPLVTFVVTPVMWQLGGVASFQICSALQVPGGFTGTAGGTAAAGGRVSWRPWRLRCHRCLGKGQGDGSQTGQGGSSPKFIHLMIILWLSYDYLMIILCGMMCKWILNHVGLCMILCRDSYWIRWLGLCGVVCGMG